MMTQKLATRPRSDANGGGNVINDGDVQENINETKNEGGNDGDAKTSDVNVD